MKRKTPIKHVVKPHTRSGVTVHKYERGKGNPPKQSRDMRTSLHGSNAYNITFFFPSGGSETYNASGTVSGAVRSAVARIQRPEVPHRAQVRRLRQ